MKLAAVVSIAFKNQRLSCSPAIFRQKLLNHIISYKNMPVPQCGMALKTDIVQSAAFGDCGLVASALGSVAW